MVPAGDRDEGSAAAEEGAAGISQEAGNLREKKKESHGNVKFLICNLLVVWMGGGNEREESALKVWG